VIPLFTLYALSLFALFAYVPTALTRSIDADNRRFFLDPSLTGMEVNEKRKSTKRW
jgi:hypothetical protein